MHLKSFNLSVYAEYSGNVVLNYAKTNFIAQIFVHHRLNGTSSPVLTATSLSYGKVKKIRPPTESKPLIQLR